MPGKRQNDVRSMARKAVSLVHAQCELVEIILGVLDMAFSMYLQARNSRCEGSNIVLLLQSADEPAGLLCLREHDPGVVQLPSLPPIPEAVARTCNETLGGADDLDEARLSAVDSLARLSLSDCSDVGDFANWKSKVGSAPGIMPCHVTAECVHSQYVIAGHHLLSHLIADRATCSDAALQYWSPDVCPQAFEWDFDIHAWAQHESNFYTMLLMELFRAQGLLVCPPAVLPCNQAFLVANGTASSGSCKPHLAPQFSCVS